MAKPRDKTQGAPRISRTSSSSGSKLAYVFGDFTLDVGRGSLACDGQELRLRPKAFSVLLYLVENHGRLVSRDELNDSVWGDTIVTDGALTQCLIEIRRALADSDQSKIRTVPRRGYLLDIPVETIRDFDRNQSATANARGLKNWRVAVLLVLGLFASGLIAWQQYEPTNAPDNGSVAAHKARSSPSIAVLPFADTSPGQDQEYFADGMADEILSLLTRVRGLRVIARTSSFSFKYKDMSIAEIAARLGVSHVLHGSVRRIDDRIRVSAQLIDASTSEQIWSESVDRRIDDVFAVQDEIAASVVDRLELSFSDQLSPARHATPEAYSLYHQAVYLAGQATATSIPKAKSLLEEVVAIDPDNAPAWRELGRLRWRYIGRGTSPREDVQAVRDALNNSIAIDANDPATIAYLAASIADFDGDLQRAARLYERAIALNPADEHVFRPTLIFLTNYGNADDAIELGEYGILRNPVCMLCADNLVHAYLRGQRYAEAEALARTIVSVHDRDHAMVGHALLLQGRPEESLDWFSKDSRESWQVTGRAMALFDLGRHAESEQLFSTFADGSEFSWAQAVHAWAYAWTGRHDEAFMVFERMIESSQKYGGEEIVRQKAWQVARIARSPHLVPLHDDPRWALLATELGITAEMQAELNIRFSLPENDF